MKLRNLSIQWITIIGVIIYRFFLDINYTHIISPIYSYMGFFESSTKTSILVSWVMLVVSIPLMFKHLFSDRLFLSNVILFIYFMNFVPTTCIIQHIPVDIEFIISICLFWILIISFSYILKPVKLPTIDKFTSNVILNTLLLLSVFSVLYVSGKYTGFRLNFNFDIIYELRMEAREFKLPTLISYLVPISNGLLPVLIVIFMVKRRWILVSCLGFVVLLNFGINGGKTIFFNLILCWLGYLYFNNRSKTFFAPAFAGLSILSFLEYVYLKSSIIAHFIIRRVLLIPSQLNIYYHRCANEYGLDYYRNSSLNLLDIKSNYKDGVAFFIGSNYFNSPDMRANNGLYSDAFINFGWFGVFIYPLMLLLFLVIFESATYNIKNKLLCLPMIVVGNTLISTFIPIALLSHGLLFILLVLFSLNNAKDPSINIKNY